jgi:tyrosine-protein kinase Etk/Wzc
MSQPTYTPITIANLIRTLIGKFRIIAGSGFLFASLMAVNMLLTENEYKSTASLFPAQQRSIGIDALLGGRLGGLAGNLLSGGRSTVFDRYIVLLSSETVQERVIEHFQLADVYETRGGRYELHETKKALARKVRFRGQVEGNFLIEVWDLDPTRAKNMADFYVSILNEFNIEVSVGEARAFREFIETRYSDVSARTDSLRLRLSDFQREFGIYELPTQLAGYFQLIGELTAMQIQSEAKMAMAASMFGRSSDAFRQAELETKTLQDRLNGLYNSVGRDPIRLNMETLPEVGTAYFQLMQEIEVHAEILKFVTPVFEQAKFEEAKALPIVSVIDHPRVPDRKDRPFRTLNVLIAGLTGLFLGCFGVVVRRVMMSNDAYFRSFLTEG